MCVCVCVCVCVCARARLVSPRVAVGHMNLSIPRGIASLALYCILGKGVQRWPPHQGGCAVCGSTAH